MEIKEKSKRGRPPAFDSDTIEYYWGTRDWRTRRTIINDLYSFEAMKELSDMEGIEYLICHSPKRARMGILTELGRLRSPEYMRQVARFICDQEAAGDHRTTHEWAATIRRLRQSDKARITETVSDNSGGGLQHDE